jgi:myosin heavy subunit
MKRMSEAKPIFLRCIKPNASKKPNDFNEKFVLLQVITFFFKIFIFSKT